MTPPAIVLARHSIVRVRGILFGLALLLAAFQFLLTQVAAYFFRRGAFNQLAALMPDFVRSAIGPSALTFMSYPGIVGLGYFHPTVLTSLVGLMIAVATEPLAEVEMRFGDLTLARPIRRGDLIVRTVIVGAVAAAMMLMAMAIGTYVGLACCTPENAAAPSGRTIAVLVLQLASVMACWLGLTLAIASGARRRAVAATIAGILALGTYLLDYLGRAWSPAERLSRLSPFSYFDGVAVITGEPLPVGDVLTLFAAGLGGAVIGFVVFGRRDI